MVARHILECLFESGVLPGFDPEDARGTGVAIEARLKGREAVGIDGLWEKCESPIEKAMLSALNFAKWPKGTEILGQEPVPPYRLDFMVRCGTHRINVECDGKEFHHHNITKAQWEADRERDRFMQAQGIAVTRYKGTDIWLHAQDCADEVASLMWGLVGGVR